MKKLLILFLFLIPLGAAAEGEENPTAVLHERQENFRLKNELKFHLTAIRSFSWSCDAIAEIQEVELYNYLYTAVICCKNGRRYSVRNMITSKNGWGGYSRTLTYCRLFKHNAKHCEEF